MKKFLIITQVVDRQHPILGFFHGWIAEFAKHCETVHVIALQVGDYDLPPNVTVHSLGKETGRGRLSYLLRFYQLIYRLRHEYDSVFVHMNQLYVILGGLLWRLLGKRIGLWYAHGAVSFSLRLATVLTHKVFTSTPQGFRIKSKKKTVTGQGIDMSRFVYKDRKSQTNTLKLITVGRVSASKQLHTLLRACRELHQLDIPFQFILVGSPVTDGERAYAQELKVFCVKEKIEDYIMWHGATTQSELPGLLALADLFIHDGVTNSLDKVLVEAVASGVPTISSNPSYRHIIGDNQGMPIYFTPGDAGALAANIQQFMSVSLVDKNQFTRGIAEKVQREHSLPNLVSGIVQSYS